MHQQHPRIIHSGAPAGGAVGTHHGLVTQAVAGLLGLAQWRKALPGEGLQRLYQGRHYL